MSCEKPIDPIRRECMDRALYAFASAVIFDERARGLRIRVRVLAFVRTGVPLVLGGSLMIFEQLLPYLLYVRVGAGVLALGAVAISGWALRSGWEGLLAYALESSSHNHQLSRNFGELEEIAPKDLETQFERLCVEDQIRRSYDGQRDVTEKEKRYGHRAGLTQFETPCDGCGEVPTSMKPSDCGCCGNF